MENSDNSGTSQDLPLYVTILGIGGWCIVLMAVTVRTISILAIAITIGPSFAYGSPACMTESEARAKFPKAHLVWVGTNHCWTFGAVRVHPQRSVLGATPVLSPRPVLTEQPVPSSRPEIDSGGIDVTGAQCRYSPCE